MWRAKDYKAMVGEHVTIEHKPVVFAVWMENMREVKSRCRMIIWWVSIECVGRILFQRLLNQDGSNGKLELLCYVERKVGLVEITAEQVQMALKRMKGRSPGIDELMRCAQRRQRERVGGESGERGER